MMLTQRLSVLAHDLAKQCQVSGQNNKTEDKTKCGLGKKANHIMEGGEGRTRNKFEERKLTDYYEVGKVIGSGGFGKVYAGTCKKTGASVAIKSVSEKKILCWSKIGDLEVPKEVALLHNLQQDYVIKLLNFFKEKDKYYIIMERPEKYIDLFDYITQKGTVSERSSRYLFQQILEAVQYCLSRGVVHRDLKDENILIDLKSYQVKLIDFGSGTFLQDTAYTDYEGTSVYSPPEWVLKKRYHAIPATIWSLGILLYNMLLGDVPFLKDSEIAMAHLSFHINISRDAEDLIRWMLAFRPQDRPTIEQVLNHPWFKVTERTSSHSQTKRPTQSSSSSTGSHHQSYSSLGSSCYHVSPYYHSRPTLPCQTPQTGCQSNHSSRPLSVGKTPPPSHSIPASSSIQTRSQTRMNRCLPPGVGHGALNSSSGTTYVGGVPRTPHLQARKNYQQVPKKK